MTAQPEQQPMRRVVSVGAARAITPLMAGLLAALGPGYRAGEFGDADVVLVPATTAVTVEGTAAVARMRRARPSVGIIAVTTGAPISPPDAVTVLDAGADAVVRVQAPAELAAHVHSVARRIDGLGSAAMSAGGAHPAGSARPAAGAAAGPAAVGVAGAGAPRRDESATTPRPRRQHGKRTRVAAAIVSGGAALGLAGAMAAHAATQSPASTTTVANPGSSDDGSASEPQSPQSQAQDDGEGTGFFGSQSTPAPSTTNGSDGSSASAGSSTGSGRVGGGATSAVPTRPHTRTRGS